jgi:hypothetical protein
MKDMKGKENKTTKRNRQNKTKHAGVSNKIIEYSICFDNNTKLCICYNKTTKPKYMKTRLWHTLSPEGDTHLPGGDSAHFHMQ